MHARLPDEGPQPRGAELDETRGIALHEPEPTPYRAKIVSELADRVADLYEHDQRLCSRLLYALNRIYQTEPGAFLLVVQILAGHADSGKSLAVIGSEQAKRRGKSTCSKQNVHQTQLRNLRKLAEIFPNVAKSVAGILGRKTF